MVLTGADLRKYGSCWGVFGPMHQAMIGGKFASLTIMNNENAYMDSMITTFNTVVTETTSEILGKHRQKKRKKLGQCRKS